MRIGLAVLAVVATAACAEPKPLATPEEIFFEYVQSTQVKHDLWAPMARTTEARRAAIAARYYDLGQFQGLVLGAFECDGKWPPFFEDRCERSAAVDEAAAGGTLFSRSVIVKHGDGSLELFVLFVVQRGDESLLVDHTGRTYADLEDFRDTNEFLTSDDTMLTAQKIASVEAEDTYVTVTGA